MRGARLIHLVSVAKSYARPGEPPQVVLCPGTISLPSDRALAVLAARRGGKTTLLQLLTGRLAPDQGEVFAADDLSPVVNASPLFHPQLSAIDNVRFLARIYGLDADALLLAADAVGGVGLHLEHPLRSQNKAQRRNLEAAVMIMLPFQCYLIDEVGQLDPGLVTNMMRIASQRRAGVIFTTSQPRFVAQHAEAAVLLEGGTMRLFNDVGEAVELFEQARRP